MRVYSPLVNQSAKNGKALEYQIANQLIVGGAAGVDKTMGFQTRDKPHFSTRPEHLRLRIIEASNVIVTWIHERSDGKVLSVRRMEDVAEDVADLVINGQGGGTIRLSIKLNHSALKHARPYSIAQGCGFAKKTVQDAGHRAAMNDVANVFRLAATSHRKTQYSELPIQKKELYHDVAKVCANSISSWGSMTSTAASLFNSYVGMGFHKVIVSSGLGGQIVLQDFSVIELPKNVVAAVSSMNDRLDLDFDNGWKIDCRVHTAASMISSPMSQLSLKFDVQRIAGHVPTSRLA